MTTFPAKFPHLRLVSWANRLANHGSFRGNALHVSLLSGAFWLTTQAGGVAYLSPIRLDSQLTGDIYLAAAQNTDKAPPENLKKRLKKPDEKRLNAITPLHYSAEADTIDDGANPITVTGRSLDLSPELIESSPVLQRWLEGAPDLLSDIAHDPGFRTRLRIGYSQFPSTDQSGGLNVGVEDVFVGRTGLTVSGDYHRNGKGDRQSYGLDLRYHLLPLGSYLNVAPVIGFRYLQTGSFNTDGINLGIRLLVLPSRTGAADISLTQTWVSPTSSEEVGVSSLSLGYAVTRDLRISIDFQAQNSPFKHDSRVGVSLEWML